MQEPTFKPTAKRIKEAKKSGDIPRSTDLNFLCVILFCCVFLLLFSKEIMLFFSALMRNFLSSKTISIQFLTHTLRTIALQMTVFFSGLFLVVLLAHVISSALFNSLIFSPTVISPQLNRLNPINGLKRLFSLNSLFDIIKTIIKFFVVLFLIGFVIYHYLFSFETLSALPINSALFQSSHLVIKTLFALIATLVIFSIIDIPYQFWQYRKRLRMTHQEIQDEAKENQNPALQ